MLFKQTPSRSIYKTKCNMKFALMFFAFCSVFIFGCQSSTDQSFENSGKTSNDTECSLGHCSTVILSQDDYLFLPDDTLFIRSLSVTIGGSSYVTSNGTVAVCECLFYKLETSKTQFASCNLTIDACTTVRLDPTDILHLSDGAVFVKSLSTRVNDSVYGVVNGSIVVCECLSQDQERDAFFNKTCKFGDGERATMSTNCSTLTLEPRDYCFQSNATLHIFAWNVTLNDSSYSVTNGSVNVCIPDCRADDGGGDRSLQILWACLMVFVFEFFASCGYCQYPIYATNRTKCKIASFLYIASSLMVLMGMIYLRVGYYDVFVLLYYGVSFLAVVEFGMLCIMSSDLIYKFFELIGATKRSDIDGLLQNPMRVKFFYWCSLILTFAFASSFRSQEFSSLSDAQEISSSDYYYSKWLKELVPMFFLYDVVIIFAAANLSIFMVSFFWYWRKVRNPNDWQVFLKITYMMYLTLFTGLTLFWIAGHSILTVLPDLPYKMLWPLFVLDNFFLSALISLFVFPDGTLDVIILFFVIQ